MDLTGAMWRKSSRSGTHNGSDCVEVAAVWRKSSRSSSNGGNCVEVAGDRRMLVRDSKDPDGPTLGFTRSEWAAFVSSVQAGRHDR